MISTGGMPSKGLGLRILVVSQHYWPESFRINEVVDSLIESGCDVTVITGQPNYPGGLIFPGYMSWAASKATYELKYDIFRVPLVPRMKGRSWHLILNYLSFCGSACIFGTWLLRKRKFDIIFVYATSPIIQVIPAIWFARLNRAKLITWVQDLWPQSLEATGFIKNSILLNAISMLAHWIYRRNDLLLVQSEAFVPLVKAAAGSVPVKYHPNPGELAFGEPESTAAPVLKLESVFNIVFAGNLGAAQALDSVLDAATILLPHHDVRIVLVGSGSRGEWIHQEVQRRQLVNVQLTGRFPIAAMPGILRQASVLLVSLGRGPGMGMTVPSKLQAYLAAGKPIIAFLDGEGAKVLEASGAGLSCAAEDSAALARTVLRLKSLSPEELSRMGDAGLDFYQRHFDPRMLCENLVQHFKEVLTSGRSNRI